jgi:hypothetical protein
MSGKAPKKSEENEIRRKDPPEFVPWSNPNELQATDRITRTTQGPGTSGSRHVARASSARYPDTSLGAEALSRPGRHHPVCIEEKRPGAVVAPGIDSEEGNGNDELAIEEGYNDAKCPPQSITPSNANEKTERSHKPSKDHKHSHKHHKKKHRKKTSTEEKEKGQIKGASDGHAPVPNPEARHLSDEARRHDGHGFYDDEEANMKRPSSHVTRSHLTEAGLKNDAIFLYEEEKEQIKERDPPDGHILDCESNANEWWIRNEAPGTENDINAKERSDVEVPATSLDDGDMVSHMPGPDVSLGVEAVDSQVHPPNDSQRRRHSFPPTRPGALWIAGPDNEGVEEDGLTIWDGNDEQEATIPPRDEPTLNVIARAVDTEEEERIHREQDQLRREYDQLRQIMENAPVVTPVAATNSDVANGDQNIHVDHDSSPRSDDPKCVPRGRRWFATSAILLVVVVITVSLVVVFSSEPTPSDPTTTPPTAQPTTTPPTAQPTTTPPTSQPTTPQNPLSQLLLSASSDATALDYAFDELSGTIPTEIGEFTKLSEYYPDWCNDVHTLILIIPFTWWRSISKSLEQ